MKTTEPLDSNRSEHDFRQLAPERLKQLIDAHQKWLQSEEDYGERGDLGNVILREIDLTGMDLRRIDLTGADLTGANLAGCDLEEVVFTSADLRGANLRGVNLRRALLVGTNLERADLTSANLRETNLGGASFHKSTLDGARLDGASLMQASFEDAEMQDANLENVHHLVSEQLAGANVTGAKLPESIGKFDALSHVEATCSIARPLYLLLLVASLFMMVTLSTTTDRELLTNAPSALLPDLSAAIPTVAFYIAGPIVLFALYVYLLIYIEQMWEDLSTLPAVFQDGSPLHRKVYPWVLLRLMARFASGRLRTLWHGLTISRAVVNIVLVFLVWWLAPMTLLFFWGRYLPARDWYVTALHIVLLVLAIGSSGFSLQSYGLLRAQRRMKTFRSFFWQQPNRSNARFRALVALAVCAALVGVSYGPISGSCAKVHNVAFKLFGYNPHANFQGVDLERADLRDADLRCADADYAVLVDANLRAANLSNAHFISADMVRADLSSVDARKARFTMAEMEDIVLRDANVEGADFGVARLQNAHFGDANLRRAYFGGAELVGATFREANLYAADFRSALALNANFRDTNLREAVFLQAELRGAYFRDAYLQNANLREADLRGALLYSADLSGADVSGANFRNAILSEVDFEETVFGPSTEPPYLPTNLSGTDLRPTFGLTQKQLDGACGSEKTKVPDGLTVELCPPPGDVDSRTTRWIAPDL